MHSLVSKDLLERDLRVLLKARTVQRPREFLDNAVLVPDTTREIYMLPLLSSGVFSPKCTKKTTRILINSQSRCCHQQQTYLTILHYRPLQAAATCEFGPEFLLRLCKLTQYSASNILPASRTYSHSHAKSPTH